MAGRKLIVQIIGDDKSLQTTLARSAAATDKFSKTVGKSLGSGVSVAHNFGPLLDRTRDMQQSADDLSERLKNLGGGFDDVGASAGRFNAGVGGVIAKAGAAGFAISAIYQASQSLQKSLQTSGEEAFTTSGRLRNLGAALMSADILGGIKALTAMPQTLEEAGISAADAIAHFEAFQRVAKGVGDVNRESAASLQEFDDAAQEAGTRSGKLAEEAVRLASSILAAQHAQDALADSTARLGTVFLDTAGNAVTFKGAVDDLGGLRGPSLVDQINANLKAAATGAGDAISPSAARAAKETVEAATGNLQELLRLQKIDLDVAKKALAGSRAKGKVQEELNQSVADATAKVIGTQKAIKAADDAAKAAAKTASDAAARAKANAIAKHWSDFISALSIGVSTAELTPQLSDDLNSLRKLKRGLESQIAAGVNVSAAQSRLVAVVGQIADKEAEIRETAAKAVQAKQFRALGLSRTGEEIIPGIKNLQARIEGALKRVASGDLDVSSKLVGRLKLARKLIREEGAKLTEDTRGVINDLINTVTKGTEKVATAPLPRHLQLSDRILKAVGLDRDPDISRLQTRMTAGAAPKLSAVTTPTAATGGVTITGSVTVVADNPDAFLRQLQKKAGRTTATARGRFPGRSLGLG